MLHKKAYSPLATLALTALVGSLGVGAGYGLHHANRYIRGNSTGELEALLKRMNARQRSVYDSKRESYTDNLAKDIRKGLITGSLTGSIVGAGKSILNQDGLKDTGLNMLLGLGIGSVGGALGNILGTHADAYLEHRLNGTNEYTNNLNLAKSIMRDKPLVPLKASNSVYKALDDFSDKAANIITS